MWIGRLEWSKVETLVNNIFGESTIRVKVYTRPNEDVVVDSDRTDGTYGDSGTSGCDNNGCRKQRKDSTN